VTEGAGGNEGREQWGTRAGFILAAVGSAIGLGNIWRYPYVAYENGGGAFLLPYFVALATAGIPILILEYALGHRSGGSGPSAYRSLSRRWEWLGWWQVMVSFVIVTYYMVILGWALSYVYYAFGTRWGEDPEAFFFGDYLGASGGFWELGGLQWKVLVPVLAVWALAYLVMRRGVRRGIEAASRILIPLLVVMFLVVTVRALTLPGAARGLNALLEPDFSALANPGVWAAYGQVFFSLSIAFSIMITYASYLPRGSDLSGSGLIAALSNASFEFLAALGVFGVLGFLAVREGVGVNEVVANGIGLAFIAFPQIISELPDFKSLFGVLFFGSLLFARFTSAVSILEPCVAAVREKFGLGRAAAVNLVCALAFLCSLLYTTGGGVRYLDTIDHFINNYGLVLSGLLEVLLVAWIAREVASLQRHVNGVSDVRVGFWWTWSLKFVTPVVLGVMTAYNLYNELRTPYEDYPFGGLLLLGWGVAVAALVVGFAFQRVKWRTAKSATRDAEGAG